MGKNTATCPQAKMLGRLLMPHTFPTLPGHYPLLVLLPCLPWVCPEPFMSVEGGGQTFSIEFFCRTSEIARAPSSLIGFPLRLRTWKHGAAEDQYCQG